MPRGGLLRLPQSINPLQKDRSASEPVHCSSTNIIHVPAIILLPPRLQFHHSSFYYLVPIRYNNHISNFEDGNTSSSPDAPIFFLTTDFGHVWHYGIIGVNLLFCRGLPIFLRSVVICLVRTYLPRNLVLSCISTEPPFAAEWNPRALVGINLVPDMPAMSRSKKQRAGTAVIHDRDRKCLAVIVLILGLCVGLLAFQARQLIQIFEAVMSF
ncbi:hypothetical protein M434DRAFT_289280 [Hypoxylon sp. CO27-5]|nr:hypothetical protein M434DRAFT_289280 [Hypoxylon sp. CO27-5]